MVDSNTKDEPPIEGEIIMAKDSAGNEWDSEEIARKADELQKALDAARDAKK